MSTNILVSSKEQRPKKESRFIIGTHDGTFHSDEVVACAILALLHSNKKVEIVRSKDISFLKAKHPHIMVDIGGGTYDHHQPGGNGERENGNSYASAGLVWRNYGLRLVSKCFLELYNSPSPDIVELVFKDIDENLIQEVDKEDNGIPTYIHYFSFISSFLPVYHTKYNNFDEGFQLALNVSIEILKHEIYETISKRVTSKTICDLISSKGILPCGILEIPSQTLSWLEPVCIYNLDIGCNLSSTPVNFVIYPYPSGGWAAQCVPPSIGYKFEQRIPFPEEWAGQTEKLPEISGVKDSTFCHNGRFFVRARTRKGVIDLCSKAFSCHTQHSS